MIRFRSSILLALACGAACAAEWSQPAEVRHDDDVCLSYRAKLDGPFLVVRAALQPGWHTFAMDNKKRADEKLAGKPALSQDRPTEITLSGGLESAGPWQQSPPKDFSKPELRWFSWGFEKEALFATKVRRSGNTPVAIEIKGQACTETTCKNIDVSISLPPSAIPAKSELDLGTLIPVR
jgi:hypothetical protein